MENERYIYAGRSGIGSSLRSGKIDHYVRWTLTFLVIAIIAAVLGFGGVASGAAGIAKVLFFVFLVLFILSLIRGGARM